MHDSIPVVPSRSPLWRAARTAWAAFALAAVVAGCRQLHVQDNAYDDGLEKPIGESTYAWAEPNTDEAPLYQRVRIAIESELAQRGASAAPPQDADVLVDFYTAIEEKVRYNDPYFTAPVAEKIELGTLVIELLEPDTRKRLWRGVSVGELRQSARAYGVNSIQFAETNAERNWRLERRVDEIFRRLP